MLINVRGSVRWQVLVHVLGKISACFANVTSIIACTGKLIHDSHTKPVRKRIFHVEKVLNFKSRANKLDLDEFGESVDEFALPLLCNTRKMPDVGDLEIVLSQLLLLDTCKRSCVVSIPSTAFVTNGGVTCLEHARDRDSCISIRIPMFPTAHACYHQRYRRQTCF